MRSFASPTRRSIKCGVEEGFRDGEVKGFHDGEVQTSRQSIFRLAQRRHIVLNDEQHQRIATCSDRSTLDRWFDNAIDASSADDIFL